jgi:hypothetical protein
VLSGLKFGGLSIIKKLQTMTNQPKDNPKDKNQKEPALKPDPETLHTTDPQDKMEGPLSSIVNNIKETVEENDEVSKEEADRKKDKSM